MSKFDEILNSSDASDALLGEQIDRVANIIDSGKWHTVHDQNFASTAPNTLENIGVEIPLINGMITTITVISHYGSSAPTGVAFTWDSTKHDEGRAFCKTTEGVLTASIPMSSGLTSTSKCYIWVSHKIAGNNRVTVSYKYEPLV